MSFYTDWFLTDVSEAPVIASIVLTEDRAHDDWPNVALRNIGEIELVALYELLRPGRDGGNSVSGELLFQGGEDGPFVSAVESRFVEALGGVPAGAEVELAERWQAHEALADWSTDELAEVLRSLTEFARAARTAGKPVLQMVVL
jgi:hypothetical protein